MKGGDHLEMEDVGQPAQLLQAWRSKDIDEFKRVLGESCDPNHIYFEEKYMPILGVIARDADPNDLKPKEFVEAILACNVDKDGQFANGLTALHLLCEKGNHIVLEALVNAGANVNAPDKNGSTALHTLIQKWKNDPHKKCLEFLLGQPSINFNAVNNAGFVPIHLAAHKKNEAAVRILLEKGSLLQLDDTFVGYDKVSPRQAIRAAFPGLEDHLPPELGPDWSFIKMDASKLFNLLFIGEEERFCIAFEKEMQDKSQKGLLTATNGTLTLLQVACEKGFIRAVENILSHGADINFRVDGDEPIRLVTRLGNSQILQLLLNHHPRLISDILGQTVLHTLVNSFKEELQYQECLQLILKEVVDKRLCNINCQDKWGNTALHYAALNFPERLVPLLLEHGSYLAVKNNKGETPLKWLPPKILEEYLDSMLGESDKNRANENYAITFNYNFLVPRSTQNNDGNEEIISLAYDKDTVKRFEIHRPTKETEPLLVMAGIPEMRKLLVHPILTSFTFLKWQRIHLFFYLNLIFYLSFCLLLSGYVIFGHRSEQFNNTKNDMIASADSAQFQNLESPSSILGLRLLILIFIVLLFLREIFQIAVNPKSYLVNVENWLELALIGLSATVVLKDCSRALPNTWGYICPQLSAIVILLAWIELLLLIGKHPLYSIQMEMLKTVSISFVRFLGWYILLIVGFALSFFVLFRGCGGDCENPFVDPGTSFFKTIVMLTGEFDSGDIPFVSFEGTSHVIFATFVFLIAIVLLNLLNGLAVADTKAIRDDAYLCTCVARVKLLAFIEDILQGDASSFLQPIIKLCSCCPDRFRLRCIVLQYFLEKIMFFPGFIPEGVIKVKPNLDSRIEFEGCPKHCDQIRQSLKATYKAKLSNYYLDGETILLARQKLELRKVPETVENKDDTVLDNCCKSIDLLMSKIQDFEKKIDAIEHTTNQIEKLIIQSMAITSLNHANNENR